jgi:O-antigen/teichoic acid export membrane protein
MRFFEILRYLKLAPFQQQTEQGRHDERYRLAALSIASSVFSRAATILLMLLSVSLTLPYLGLERFGLWMTISSFAVILSFLDFGVGNALTNHVAQRSAKDDPYFLCQAISGGLGFLALVSFLMSLLLILIINYLPWWQLIKVSDQGLMLEARYAANCFALFFGLSIFTSGVQRVFSGLQIAYQANVVALIITFIACFVLWLAASAHQGISVLLSILMGSQSAVGLILLLVLRVRKQFSLNCIVTHITNEGRQLFKTGGLFFLLQLGTVAGWGADSFIISSTIGVANVGVFVVVQRLFQFATQPFSIINAPLWAAYADANARQDKKFIKKTLIKSMQTTFFGVCLSVVVLMMIHTPLIDMWTKGTVVAPLTLVLFYAVWVVFEALGNAFAMFLNGLGIVSIQVKVVVIFILLVLPLKIMLVKSVGISGMPIATLFAYIVATLGVYGIYLRKVLIGVFH